MRPTDFDKKCLQINEFARKCHKTKDKKYNEGLALVQTYGYRAVCMNDAVQYWRLCEGI